MLEHDEQCLVVQYLRLQGKVRGDIGLQSVFAIPNGGSRHIVTARKLKAEGVLPGVPDLFIPCPRNGYHGMFVEMKSTKGKATAAQKEMMWHLQAQGYHVVVCKGHQEAIDAANQYLGI
jgi:hypothetical protein